MNVGVLFLNIGSYHAARLRAANAACQKRGWNLIALQTSNWTFEHPWGDLSEVITFDVETLVPCDTKAGAIDSDEIVKQAVPVLLSRLRKIRPDVLVVPGWSTPEARACIRWHKSTGIPLVVMSESKHDDERRSWWKEKAKQYFYIRHFCAALVGGKRHQEYLVELGMSPNVIFLGYDAVDNDHFSRGAERARAAPDLTRREYPGLPVQPYVLAISRFIPRKNLEGLIAAYAMYREEVDNPWDLVLCGSGPGEARIQGMIAQLGIQESVHLPGFVPYQALGAWYGLASAFVHPAYVEPWGLAISEACAAGVPILCSCTAGAQYELIDEGRNGLLFNPGSVNEIRDCLTTMHHLTPSERYRMGREGQKIVASFGLDRFAEGFVAAVESAVSGETS